MLSLTVRSNLIRVADIENEARPGEEAQAWNRLKKLKY
jgi:hypothetical protein